MHSNRMRTARWLTLHHAGGGGFCDVICDACREANQPPGQNDTQM